MKLMIASDLHGSAYHVNELMEAFRREKPDRLLLLGDLLYHGPRNALPRDYDCMAVAERLNGIKGTILPPGAVLLNGHFHVPVCHAHEDYLYLNPGSTSIPKDGSVGGYLVLEERTFSWRDMSGQTWQTHTV